MLMGQTEHVPWGQEIWPLDQPWYSLVMWFGGQVSKVTEILGIGMEIPSESRAPPQVSENWTKSQLCPSPDVVT